MECVSSKPHFGACCRIWKQHRVFVGGSLESGAVWTKGSLKNASGLAVSCWKFKLFVFFSSLIRYKIYKYTSRQMLRTTIFFFSNQKLPLNSTKSRPRPDWASPDFAVWIWLNTAHVWMDPGHHRGWSDTHVFQRRLHAFDVHTWCSELPATCPVSFLIRACIDHLHSTLIVLTRVVPKGSG